MDPYWTDAGFLLALERFGYDVSDALKATIAFQRRFRPERIDGIVDGECRAKLLALLLPRKCRQISHIALRQGTGRPRPSQDGRGKSGLHGTTVPGNARRAERFGEQFRESATESIPPAFGSVRAKGCGKSAPRGWQQARHGKPHRVQDRIGVAHGSVPTRHPGWLLERRSDPSPRGMVAQASSDAGQNPAYRSPDDFSSRLANSPGAH